MIVLYTVYSLVSIPQREEGFVKGKVARGEYTIKTGRPGEPTLTTVGDSQTDEHTLLATRGKLAVFDEVLALVDRDFAPERAKPADVRLNLVMNCIGNCLVDTVVRKVVIHVSVVVCCAAPKLRRELGLQQQTTDAFAQGVDIFLAEGVLKLLVRV